MRVCEELVSKTVQCHRSLPTKKGFFESILGEVRLLRCSEHSTKAGQSIALQS